MQHSTNYNTIKKTSTLLNKVCNERNLMYTLNKIVLNKTKTNWLPDEQILAKILLKSLGVAKFFNHFGWKRYQK